MTTGSAAGRTSRTVALGIAVLLGLVAPAIAQEPNCPPNSNSPRCTGEDPGGTSGEPGNPQRSEPPPGQVEEPAAPADSSTPSQPPASSVAPPPEDDTQEQQSPPDLGAVRTLTSRFQRVPGSGSSLEVVVDERRAGGVDGGWSVTVQVADAALGAPDASVQPGSISPGVPRPGRAGEVSDVLTLFTVVGQRSEQEYDASYRGSVLVGARDTLVPTITVTLFQ